MRASIVPMVAPALLFLACQVAFATHFSLGCFVVGAAVLTVLRVGQIYRRAELLGLELAPRQEMTLVIDSLAVAVQLVGLPCVACLIIALYPVYRWDGFPGLPSVVLTIGLGLTAASLIAAQLRPRLWPYALPEPAKKPRIDPAPRLAEWYETVAH